jgi:cytochrome c-type biogenesis protein
MEMSGGEPALEALFNSLTHAVEGSPAIALGAAFLWGILSVVLSPCHLATIPLIVGFIDRQGELTTRRAFAVSALFAAGILITIGAIGAITAAAGQLLGGLGPYGNYVLAVVLLLAGLYLLDVFPTPWSAPSGIGMKRKGLLAAFVLGLVYGVALGPCTFAYMAPMLAIALKLAAYGAVLLAAYGIGHCSVIVFAGTFSGLVQGYLDWNERSRGAIIIKRTCAVLVIVAGLYLLYMAPPL